MSFKEMPSSPVIMMIHHFDSTLLLFFRHYFTHAENGKLNSGDAKMPYNSP